VTENPTPVEEQRILGYLTVLIRRGFIPLARASFTFVVYRNV
jgi:hypothetical protein